MFYSILLLEIDCDTKAPSIHQYIYRYIINRKWEQFRKDSDSNIVKIKRYKQTPNSLNPSHPNKAPIQKRSPNNRIIRLNGKHRAEDLQPFLEQVGILSRCYSSQEEYNRVPCWSASIRSKHSSRIPCIRCRSFLQGLGVVLVLENPGV